MVGRMQQVSMVLELFYLQMASLLFSFNFYFIIFCSASLLEVPVASVAVAVASCPHLPKVCLERFLLSCGRKPLMDVPSACVRNEMQKIPPNRCRHPIPTPPCFLQCLIQNDCGTTYMCIYMYNIYTHIHIYTCVYTHTYIYTYTYVCTSAMSVEHIYIYTYTYVELLYFVFLGISNSRIALI